MRHEKGARLLEIARMMAASAEGVTLEEIGERLGVARRTAERMRDAVRDLFPAMEEVEEGVSKRFRIPGGLDGLFQVPTAEEMTALSAAAEMMDRQGAGGRAAALRSLEQKVLSATRASARRRLAPDLEALLQAEAVGPRNWRLDRIHDIKVTGDWGARPEDFSLQAYADESFGIYQDDTEDVVLRVTPEGAEDALRSRFHAKQKVEPQEDGGVIVRFRASGMRELAWHLFTWGDKVEIVAPQALKDMMAGELAVAVKTHVRN